MIAGYDVLVDFLDRANYGENIFEYVPENRTIKKDCHYTKNSFHAE